MNDKTEASYEYWRGIGSWSGGNAPSEYAKVEMISSELVDIFDKYVNKGSECEILEIGCNVGRNLNEFYSRGYNNLSGIEISPASVKFGEAIYNEMHKNSNILVGRAKEKIKEIAKIDVVFTMAVLLHIDDKERAFLLDWIYENSEYAVFIEPRKDSNFSHISTSDKVYAPDGRLFNPIDCKEEMETRGATIIYEGIPQTPVYKVNYEVVVATMNKD